MSKKTIEEEPKVCLLICFSHSGVLFFCLLLMWDFPKLRLALIVIVTFSFPFSAHRFYLHLYHFLCTSPGLESALSRATKKCSTSKWWLQTLVVTDFLLLCEEKKHVLTPTDWLLTQLS